MRKNSLLAKPPRAMFSHGACDEPRELFKYVTGRSIQQSDWNGVHLTNSFELAQSYATGAANKHGGPGVIVGVSVREHRLLPEIDGISNLGSYLLDARLDFKKEFERTGSLVAAERLIQNLCEQGQMFEDTSEVAVVFHDYFYEYCGIVQYFEAIGGDWRAALHEFLSNGTIPNDVIVHGSGIGRVMSDIPESDVVCCSLTRPWLAQILEDEDWDDEDWDEEKVASKNDYEQAMAEGDTVVCRSDVDHFQWPIEVIVHAQFAVVEAASVWWHGTSVPLASKSLGSLWRLVAPIPSLRGPRRESEERRLAASVQGQVFAKPGRYTPAI